MSRARSVLRNEPVTHHAYKRYLIRWSIFTLDKPSNRIWIEKDSAFIGWAQTIDEAKATIDLLTDGQS